jgi:hypothetical protein
MNKETIETAPPASLLQRLAAWWRAERECDDCNIDELCGHDWNPEEKGTK